MRCIVSAAVKMAGSTGNSLRYDMKCVTSADVREDIAIRTPAGSRGTVTITAAYRCSGEQVGVYMTGRTNNLRSIIT